MQSSFKQSILFFCESSILLCACIFCQKSHWLKLLEMFLTKGPRHDLGLWLLLCFVVGSPFSFVVAEYIFSFRGWGVVQICFQGLWDLLIFQNEVVKLESNIKIPKLYWNIPKFYCKHCRITMKYSVKSHHNFANNSEIFYFLLPKF